MKYENELLFTCAFIIFLASLLIFYNIGDKSSVILSLIGFLYILLLCVLIIIKYIWKEKENNLLDQFNQHHAVIRLLIMLVLISVIYDIFSRTPFLIIIVFVILLIIAFACEKRFTGS